MKHLTERPVDFGMPVFCLGEFLRVVTHRRVFEVPSTHEQAWDYLDTVLASPSARVLSPGQQFEKLLREQTEEAKAQGNLIFDAQIVATAVEHGAGKVLSADRDLHRFPDIEVISPSTAPS